MEGSRIIQTKKTFGHLPAWRCWSRSKGVFYLCGHCFGLRGSGPATNAEEVWKPGTDAEGNFHWEVVPKNAICEQCGSKAWPKG
jgi:hypothetical protein